MSIAALLPILEAFAARGGASALAGGAVAEGGILGSVGRMFGASAFSSEAELGQALRQISDLSSSIEAAKQSMEANRQKQESVASKAREDERLYMTSDPGHTQQLADLARQNQAHQSAMAAAHRQMAQLQNRANLTTNPAAAQALSATRATAALGVGAAVAGMAPGIIRNSPPVIIASNVAQAATNVAGNFAGPQQAQIAGQMGNFASNTLGRLNPLNMASSVLTRGPLGPLEELSKVGVEIAKLPQHIQDWSRSLIESQRHMSRFNGVLSQMFAQQERREIVRGIQSAQRTGGATSELSDAMQDLQDILQPMRDTVTVVLARGLTTGLQLITEGVRYLQGIWEYVKRFPGAKDINDLIEAKAESDRLDAAIKMRPLVSALRDIERRDKSKPKSVPRR